ncbi:trifunctional hydroxymethylpyrimidine kinase/phosphomethylpyrimidine kinase/thiaminase [Blastocladiella emersonii ATCC 22665]|nr:trifunctional hydroxymethylpyrimidine kinase/phosphomethylpyrimidine kinase/thiaminase [Blastocladiella emersonii ATCC 22665]
MAPSTTTTSANGLPLPPPRALTIAGSDSGGGAGIQADLKTFAALSAYGMSVVTALTAQNTLGVDAIHPVPDEFVAAQYESVSSDLGVDAVKTGMLFSGSLIRTVAKCLSSSDDEDDEVAESRRPWLVVDPVMVATSGDALLAADAVGALVDHLLPLASVVTPNLPETELLLAQYHERFPDRPRVATPITSVAGMREAARAIHALGPQFVLVKGGHLPLDAMSLAPIEVDAKGDLVARGTKAAQNAVCVDVLYDAKRDNFTVFRSPRVDSTSTHGTGCTLSAAIAAHLARTPRSAGKVGGDVVVDAVRRSIAYVHHAIVYASPSLGMGHGPLNHGFAIAPWNPTVVGDAPVVGNGGVEVDLLPGPVGGVTDALAKVNVDEADTAEPMEIVTLTELGWRREAQLVPTPRSFVALLKNACAAEWRAYTHHAFVQGMADGTLPIASFKHYLTQDYVFLTHFARCNALAAYKSQTMTDIVFSADIVCHIAREAQLHVGYCAEWGIDRAALAATPEARANMAYTRFTLDRGMAGDVMDLRAALAPCLFGYGDIGTRLAADPKTVKDHDKNPYWRWISNYAAPDYQAACRDGEILLERLAVELGVWHAPARVAALVETFRKATRLEIGFWDMGLNVEW